jgi:hypothetical protein
MIGCVDTLVTQLETTALSLVYTHFAFQRYTRTRAVVLSLGATVTSNHTITITIFAWSNLFFAIAISIASSLISLQAGVSKPDSSQLNSYLYQLCKFHAENTALCFLEGELLSCCLRIRCRANVFTVSLPSNERLYWFNCFGFGRHVTIFSLIIYQALFIANRDLSFPHLRTYLRFHPNSLL